MSAFADYTLLVTVATVVLLPARRALPHLESRIFSAYFTLFEKLPHRVSGASGAFFGRLFERSR